ncbi:MULTISPECIES: ectonucleotide pyrophosphatase/phosphodiesterase [Dyella]|uniref:Alkaline phosphatase family protein n=2 Tax=Dyella TaxID=231454 RepID=A0A4R0YVN7_9GAMM|nr:MULTISPECIES: ectonucleotide pyrophosphatase/phosphodiesterase [Dyella]TBR38916.1 alkaline phosphatase family protein [Dyella terrae]TCI13493.1 alkaline phosphatase family protein [Dyella soli]
MKIPFRLALSAVIAFSSGCATQAPTPATAPPAPVQTATAGARTPLLLISIDGYRADYIDRHLSPTLATLAKDGVKASALIPSFPSLTFPNHYTIVTGLRPDHHGIVNNTMSDPRLGNFSLSNRKAAADGNWWAEGTPIWESAGRQGLHTATMFWPGSEADIHGYRPDHWLPYDGKITADQRVDQVLAWLDLPPSERPGFLTLYFDDVDHAGHSHGPDSKEVNEALGIVDTAMARLVAGLKQRQMLDAINIVVVSDHGMAATPVKNSVMIDQIITLDHVQQVSLGVLAGFNPKPGFDFERVKAKLVQPHEHMQCWDKASVPARFQYGSNARVPQVVCLAQTGWRITTNAYMAKRMKDGSVSLGDHGYDNQDPNMRAMFIAHGPAFRSGVNLPDVDNVDIYPMMTRILGIQPATNDGDVSHVQSALKPH